MNTYVRRKTTLLALLAFGLALPGFAAEAVQTDPGTEFHRFSH